MSGNQGRGGGRPPRMPLGRQGGFGEFSAPAGSRGTGSGDTASPRGYGMGRGFGGPRSGDTASPQGLGRGSLAVGPPSNAPTGPRNNMPGGDNAVTGLAFPVGCYKPPEHSFMDQEDAHKQHMGMDERDTICLRCGKDKSLVQHARNLCDADCVRCPDDPQHSSSYCPRLYCTQAWHKRHGFGKMAPKDEVMRGLCRIRPNDEEIDKLVKMGQLWAKQIKKGATFNQPGKRTAGDAFEDDAEAAEREKRARVTISQLNSRVLAEMQLRKEAERKLEAERAEWLAQKAHYKRIIYDYERVRASHQSAKDSANESQDAVDAVDAKKSAASKAAAGFQRAIVDAGHHGDVDTKGAIAMDAAATFRRAKSGAMDASENAMEWDAGAVEGDANGRPVQTLVRKGDHDDTLQGLVEYSDSD